MKAGGAERIEILMDAVAAAILATAAAWCALKLPLTLPMVGGAAAVAFGCAFALLRVVRPEDRRFPIGDFAPVEPPVVQEELSADEEEQVAEPAGGDELLLDDVLADIPLDSRVVRLFDPSVMPTPGELRARIDRHLGSDRVSAAPPEAVQVDASQALHEALAELRRSLR